jgi:hypothetical protein
MSADSVLLAGSSAPLLDPVAQPSPAQGTSEDSLLTDLRLAGAIDVDEIAAVLESRGINDRAARERFGYRDVFDLADRLSRLPRPVAVRRPPRPEPVGGQTVLRGVCFASPGVVVYALTAGVPVPAGSAVDTAAILLSVVAGWSASQAVSALGDGRLHADAAGAAAVMATAGAAVVAISSVVAVGGWALAGLQPWAVIFCLGQVGYCVASAVALLLGRAGMVLCALLPALLAAAVAIGAGSSGTLPYAAVAASMIAVTAVAAVRVLRTCRVARRPGRDAASRVEASRVETRPGRDAARRVETRPGRDAACHVARRSWRAAVPSGRELIACAPAAGLGAVLATLLITGLASWLAAATATGGVDRAALPLIIGVVLIEIEFVRFDNRLRARMVTVHSIVELRRASVGVLLFALCRYLLFCGAFAAGLGALATGGGPFAGSAGGSPGEGWHLLWALALGSMYLLAALLAQHRRHALLLLVTGPPAIGLAVCTIVDQPGAADRVVLSAVSVTLTAALLLVACLVQLGRPEAYR